MPPLLIVILFSTSACTHAFTKRAEGNEMSKADLKQRVYVSFQTDFSPTNCRGDLHLGPYLSAKLVGSKLWAMDDLAPFELANLTALGWIVNDGMETESIAFSAVSFHSLDMTNINGKKV